MFLGIGHGVCVDVEPQDVDLGILLQQVGNEVALAAAHFQDARELRVRAGGQGGQGHHFLHPVAQRVPERLIKHGLSLLFC